MKTPTESKLQAQADAWNQSNPPGTSVIRYKLVHPLREPTPTVTTSPAWVMGGHSVMVLVRGMAGGVSLDSVRVVK